jgi:protein TonB
MAGRSTARRTDKGRSHPARPVGRPWPEAGFAGPRGEIAADVTAVLTLAPKPPHPEPLAAAAPPVVVTGYGPAGATAPAVEIVPPTTMHDGGSAPVPTIAGAAAPARRIGAARGASLAVIASLILHAAAAAAIVWLSWTAPPPISAGEEGIPVELVVASDTGAAAQQEAASGRQETEAATTDSQSMQKVEAPPVETPEPSASDPVETAFEEPPVAQPDPLTTAARILDQLPPPPMPELLPIVDRPAEPFPAEARSTQPRLDALQPPPAVPTRPEPVEAAAPPPVTSLEPAATSDAPESIIQQAALAPQPVDPPPAQVMQPSPPAVAPPVRHEATRPPPTRREAPVTQERRRPTRQVAATAQPERPVRAAPQAESRASLAERGEGIGQRNRQQSNATGPSGASNVAAVAAWRQRVLAHLARYRVYPEQARERGIRGRTGVAFTLTGNGAVTAVSIASSSGAAILDQATLAMVRRAQPFPPNPAGGSASFTAGINYSLN